MSFWLAGIFFFGGVLVHKFLSLLLDLSHASIAYKKLEDAMLDMLMALDIDMLLALERKYEALKLSGLSEEEIKKRKIVDAEVLIKWRNAVIINVIATLPKSFYRYVNFATWQEAREHAVKRNQKRKKEDRKNGRF
jgi:hypothetical protein